MIGGPVGRCISGGGITIGTNDLIGTPLIGLEFGFELADTADTIGTSFNGVVAAAIVREGRGIALVENVTGAEPVAVGTITDPGCSVLGGS